jgi:hypothetical protein
MVVGNYSRAQWADWRIHVHEDHRKDFARKIGLKIAVLSIHIYETYRAIVSVHLRSVRFHRILSDYEPGTLTPRVFRRLCSK